MCKLEADNDPNSENDIAPAVDSGENKTVAISGDDGAAEDDLGGYNIIKCRIKRCSGDVENGGNSDSGIHDASLGKYAIAAASFEDYDTEENFV